MKSSNTSEPAYASYKMAQWWFGCAVFAPLAGLALIGYNVFKDSQVDTLHVALSVLFYLLMTAYQIFHFNFYSVAIRAKKISRGFLWWVRIFPAAMHLTAAGHFGLIPVLNIPWPGMVVFVSGYISNYIIWSRYLEGKLTLH